MDLKQLSNRMEHSLHSIFVNKRSDLSVYFMQVKLKMMIVNEGGNSLG
jgi:hypothetical protein